MVEGPDRNIPIDHRVELQEHMRLVQLQEHLRRVVSHAQSMTPAIERGVV
jgi:hypothetical protein